MAALARRDGSEEDVASQGASSRSPPRPSTACAARRSSFHDILRSRAERLADATAFAGAAFTALLARPTSSSPRSIAAVNASTLFETAASTRARSRSKRATRSRERREEMRRSWSAERGMRGGSREGTDNGVCDASLGASSSRSEREPKIAQEYRGGFTKPVVTDGEEIE